MTRFRMLVPVLLLLALPGCETLSSIAPWTGKSADLKPKADPGSVPVEELYNNGVDALNGKRYRAAVEQFDAVEQNYPYSSWAVNAQLMHGYTEYLQNQQQRTLNDGDSILREANSDGNNAFVR